MRSLRILWLFLLVAAALTGRGAFAGQQSAEAWVSLIVAPALVQELATHPRYKNQSVRIVVFENGLPAASSNAFAASLRNRLANAMFDTPGIRMAALQGPNDPLDCTLDDVDYFVGLQVTPTAGNEVRIDLRTLDVVDRSWVTGFELSWEGRLNDRQRAALAKTEVDTFFRGERAAPFAATEADMLAADLARELACASVRQTMGEFVVYLDEDQLADGTAELISNNLTAFALLHFTDDATLANAELRGKAHVVEDGLTQYWATIAPLDPASELPTLNASAYVKVPEAPPAPPPAVVDVPAMPPPVTLRASQSVLRPASLVEVSGQAQCPTHGNRCTAMQINAKRDAVIFFLNHQKNHGLVRLSGRDCRALTRARLVRANESLSEPLPIFTVTPSAIAVTDSWTLAPDADTYVAIAVSDSKAARIISRHLLKLPQRCTTAVRFGLRDEELAAWADEFTATVDKFRKHVDWQAVQVRNVY